MSKEPRQPKDREALGRFVEALSIRFGDCYMLKPSWDCEAERWELHAARKSDRLPFKLFVYPSYFEDPVRLKWVEEQITGKMEST